MAIDRSRFPSVSAAAGLLALLGMLPVHAAVGTQVLLQIWNPQQPQTQSLATVGSSPSIVSDTLAAFWAGAGRASACQAVNAALANFKPRLYDLDCRLSPTADLQALPSDNGQVALRIVVPKNTLLASAAIEAVPDPRFSVDFDLQLDLTLAATRHPNRLLEVTKAEVGVAAVRVDSRSFVADLATVADALARFLGGPDFKRLGGQALARRDPDFRRQVGMALTPVNAQLALPTTMAAGRVRVGVWSRPGQLTVAFAPRAGLAGGGAIEGTVRWDAPSAQIPRCEDLRLAATVQVGPRPMRSPEGALGIAPVRTVSALRAQPVAPGACRYRVDGLAVGLPHRLDASAHGDVSSSSPIVLRPANGRDGTITPQPVATVRDYLIETGQTTASPVAIGSPAEAAALPR